MKTNNKLDVDLLPQSARNVRTVTLCSAAGNAKSIILTSSAFHLTQSNCPLLVSAQIAGTLDPVSKVKGKRNLCRLDEEGFFC
jgi:hypothetical protein